MKDSQKKEHAMEDNAHEESHGLLCVKF